MPSNIVELRDKKNRKGTAKRCAKFEDLSRQFLDRGIPVFPLAEDTKMPLSKSHRFLDASTDPKQIRKWAKRFPSANLGIPTGKVSNLVVLDLDRKGGKDGISSFRALCKKLDIKTPNTYKIQTPSGGRHLYFKSEFAGSIINSVSALGEGIDVRADRGYIVSEGSSIDGDRYSRISGSIDELATLPEKLRLAMQSGKAMERGTREFPKASAMKRCSERRAGSVQRGVTSNKSLPS